MILESNNIYPSIAPVPSASVKAAVRMIQQLSRAARIFIVIMVGALICTSWQSCAVARQSRPSPVYRSQLEGFQYPWPVLHYRFTSQNQPLDMAYMDIRSAHPNGRVAVLLHGKNFCSATWKLTIIGLRDAGYRVIAPDQIGFCKSTKPIQYQYSFQQLAANTHALLGAAGVGRVILIGHSTGGMLAVRYALMYPHEVEHLVLVDPLGLEDWKAKGVPWQSVDDWAREQRTTAEQIRNYERTTYYVGEWRPEYEQWVDMLAGMFQGPGGKLVAWNSALLYDMIFTQPVVYEFDRLSMPVLLIIGDKDRSALGKDHVSAQLRARLGDYPALARAAVRRMKIARLIEFPELGHAPQMQAPQRFNAALLAGIEANQ